MERIANSSRTFILSPSSPLLLSPPLSPPLSPLLPSSAPLPSPLLPHLPSPPLLQIVSIPCSQRCLPPARASAPVAVLEQAVAAAAVAILALSSLSIQGTRSANLVSFFLYCLAMQIISDNFFFFFDPFKLLFLCGVYHLSLIGIFVRFIFVSFDGFFTFII